MDGLISWEEQISLCPTKLLLEELGKRFSAGFIGAFVTDASEFLEEGSDWYEGRINYGPRASQEGLLEHMIDDSMLDLFEAVSEED